jgi:GPI-GlcNAc transferase complex, PIG-H component
VLRGLGIQTSTSSPTYLSTSTTRFIPSTQIQDIVIHEAFKGLEVRFYLAIIVEGATKVVVVFPVWSSLPMPVGLKAKPRSTSCQGAKSLKRSGEVLENASTRDEGSSRVFSSQSSLLSSCALRISRLLPLPSRYRAFCTSTVSILGFSITGIYLPAILADSLPSKSF